MDSIENNKSFISNPQSILFICNFNSVRSPMAEAIAKFHYGNKIFIDSVGIHKRLQEINPFAVSVMAEIDIDVSSHVPKNYEELNDGSFDVVITLCPEAHHRALDLTKLISTSVEYWPTNDPTQIHGNRDAIMNDFRDVRNYLDKKIKTRLS